MKGCDTTCLSVLGLGSPYRCRMELRWSLRSCDRNPFCLAEGARSSPNTSWVLHCRGDLIYAGEVTVLYFIMFTLDRIAINNILNWFNRISQCSFHINQSSKDVQWIPGGSVHNFNDSRAGSPKSFSCSYSLIFSPELSLSSPGPARGAWSPPELASVDQWIFI